MIDLRHLQDVREEAEGAEPYDDHPFLRHLGPAPVLGLPSPACGAYPGPERVVHTPREGLDQEASVFAPQEPGVLRGTVCCSRIEKELIRLIDHITYVSIYASLELVVRLPLPRQRPVLCELGLQLGLLARDRRGEVSDVLTHARLCYLAQLVLAATLEGHRDGPVRAVPALGAVGEQEGLAVVAQPVEVS